MSKAEEEFLAIFRDEARERLERIVNTLLTVESGTATPDATDSLFRDVHTIKGAAGMVGLDDVRRLAHAMEDVLAGARERGSFAPELIDPLLRGADALQHHVDETGGPVDALIAELEKGIPAAAPSPDADADVTVTPSMPEKERRSIRVTPDKIDTLLDLVGETVLHRKRLEHSLTGAVTVDARAVSDELDAGERLLDGLKDAAIGMRTLPFGTIVGPLPRAVRDLAAEAGKDVELSVEGADTELDRAILEGLSELLVHLARNAIAHGIEDPDERERAGKPRRAKLEVRAVQRGGVVEVIVADDGRGVSRETLDEAQKSSLTEVLAQAGYSTAGAVSEISGRGVGLDVVKREVESVAGSLEIRSETGRGFQVVMRLPLALALLEVLLVERGGSVYGLPLASVEEAISLGETTSLGGRPAIELRGRSIPLADLAELVGGSATPPADRAPALIVSAGGRRVAAICDTLLGEEEVVVKSLGPLLRSLPSYLGGAILGDGRLALLVDPAAVVNALEGRPTVPRARPVEAAPAAENGTSEVPTVLVVEDSLAMRELQRGILESAGYRVETARDGRDALERLTRDTFDLVLTDVEMPEMDGLELTRTIRADPARSDLPIVIVTSLGTDKDRQRGADAGADAYMVKHNFDQKALLETIERLTGR